MKPFKSTNFLNYILIIVLQIPCIASYAKLTQSENCHARPDWILPFLYSGIKGSKDDSYLAIYGALNTSSNAAGLLYLWRMPSRKLIQSKRFPSVITGIGFSPDEKFLILGFYDKTLMILSLPKLDPVFTSKYDSAATVIKFSEDHSQFAIGFQNGEIKLFDSHSLQLINHWRAHIYGVNALIFNIITVGAKSATKI